jgi:large subunit ribosomal protein L25
MTQQVIALAAQTRPEQGKKVKSVRLAGKIPAVLYGKKISAQSLSLDYVAFEKVLNSAGESTLVDLVVDNNPPVKVLIQDYQMDPVKNLYTHVDFHQVSMDEKIHAEIQFEFVGESMAVKTGGVLLTNLQSIEVECLPGDLVHEIKVDISKLATYDDVIHVKDINLPSGLKVLYHELEDVIALVQEPRSEKELASLDEAVEATLPENVKEEPVADSSDEKAK